MTPMNKEQSPINHYHKLATQVLQIRLILPVLLFVVGFIVESHEHIISEHSPEYFDFILEVGLFGIIGPAIIAAVLTWIARKLDLLAAAQKRIEAFNIELEQKIQSRTAELESANNELRQLDQLKSEFVSLVSHELRTPLTNIRGGLEIIMTEPNGNRSLATNETVTIVQVEVNRLIRLVQRILDVSALDSGQLQLNCGPMLLRPIIDHIRKESLRFDGVHPLQLELPSPPVLVIADEDRIRDILINLLSNAIKYSPAGSPIILRLKNCGDHAQISVQDFGVGIPINEQPHLMNQFYRGTVSSDIQGYGLGLYFAKKLIEAHGGKLWVESQGIPGKGSEFYFTLPLDKEVG